MNKLGLILILNSLILFQGFSQSLVYTCSIAHEQKINAANTGFNPLFASFSSNPEAEILARFQLEIKIFHEKETQYSLYVSLWEDSIVGDVYYKKFSLADLFYPERIFIKGNILNNELEIIHINIHDKKIPESRLVFDTVFNCIPSSTKWQHQIEYLQFYFNPLLSNEIEKRIKKIDNYYLNDSLFFHWAKELDKINLSDIDLLPLHKFTLQEIEQEVLLYADNKFENLLSSSNLDNSAYLKKISSILNRIQTIKNYLNETLPEMDEMLFRKAKQFESQNNTEKAIYYFRRALDYNPTHCKSCLSLSHYYINKKEFVKAISLLSRLYKDSMQTVENHTIANELYDILLATAKEQINKKDYYSAIKTLDTLGNYCSLMPENFCKATHTNLKTIAIQGIYNAYFDVIRQAIRNNCFVLSINYLQGLELVMENNGDSLQANNTFQDVFNQLFKKYSQSTNQKIAKKQYTNVISETDEFKNALDSTHFLYPETLFDDIYTRCYTNLYLEKVAIIEEMKSQKKLKYIEAEINILEAFYNTHKQYIKSISEPIIEKEIAYDNQNELEKLCYYINNKQVSASDYDFLDSCCRYYQLKENEIFEDCIDSNVINTKLIPIIQNGISQINIHAWGNEFNDAINLYIYLEGCYKILGLESNKYLTQKLNDSKLLLETRSCNYISQLLSDNYYQSKQLIEKKEYVKAWNKLKEIPESYMYCKNINYRDSINILLHNIEHPAYFQEIHEKALRYIMLQFYSEGFSLYEQALQYYRQNNVKSYGLNCKELLHYIESSNRTSDFVSLCEYYIEKQDFSNAMKVMFLSTLHHIPFEETQNKLGETYRKHVDSNNQNLLEVINQYSFTKEHLPFLNAYLRKGKAYSLYFISKKNKKLKINNCLK
ncbi:MAG: hypothetical protein GX612_07465 [Bacteroidales bacterium]|nr:hypothetical protein [Bacteroidales bacterium]